MTHVGILPDDVLEALSATLDGESKETRFLRLPHPRTGIPSLFLPYQLSKKGESSSAKPASKSTMAIVEVQAVQPTDPRSWFMGDGEIIADGKLLIMTPIDPVFLLIPILKAVQLKDGTSGPLRPADDIFQDAAEKLGSANSVDPKDPSASMACAATDVLHFTSLDRVQNALRRVCEVKVITEELTVYRLSQPKLLEYLRVKVARVASVDVFDRSRTLVRVVAKQGLTEDGYEGLLEAGRLRAACDTISQYLPGDLKTALFASYDFSDIDKQLKKIADEEAAAAAVEDSKTGKRKLSAAASKDKLKLGEKRKDISKSSQGVDKLKKVNTTGMAKMSSFFAKKPQA